MNAKKTCYLLLTAAVIFTTPWQPATADHGGPGGHVCLGVADMTLKSCRREGWADHWIEAAKCRAFDDAADRQDCIADVVLGTDEKLDECGAQHEGRQNLCGILDENRYAPEIDPANFVNPDDIGGAVAPNPFFPLVVGNEWVYQSGLEEGTVTVLDEIRMIQGVPCRVVRDEVTDDGDPLETTLDWYAQDLAGNLWYFGEIAMNYEDGDLLDLDGSWEAGRDGAHAGMLIPFSPVVDQMERQEFLLGEAEDVSKVLSVAASPPTEVAGFECNGTCLQTEETTPIEPDTLENKYYLPGVGMVKAIDLESGDEEVIVSFTQL